jgi:replicative DNA helicase
MRAARKLPVPLDVVSDPVETDAAPGGDNEWRSQTVIDQYSPEHQFVGSLMWLRAEEARPLLNLVPDTAIWRPRTRWAYELIRGLVEAGTDPTPVSVLAAGRHQAARDAIDEDTPPTPNRHKQLALYLFDAYAQAVAPATAIKTYAGAVLDEAYRRAFDTCGIRMQQLAASGADRGELTHQLTAIRDELADLWRRAETAAQRDGSQPSQHRSPGRPTT